MPANQMPATQGPAPQRPTPRAKTMVTTQGGSHSRAGSRAAWLLFLICYGLACAVILLPRGSLTQTGHANIEASSLRR